MPTKQRTIRKERSIKGKSLHTGEEVTLTLKPAEADQGYVFRRVDLYGKPEVLPKVEIDNAYNIIFGRIYVLQCINS